MDTTYFRKRNVVILAAKDITQNRRVPLLAKYFAQMNYSVHVYAYTLPHSDYNESEVCFYPIPAPTLCARILEWIETTETDLEDIWRPRFGGSRLAGWGIGGAEFLKYHLRRPLSSIIHALWGHGQNTHIDPLLKSEDKYAQILRSRFGSAISDSRRKKFNKTIKLDVQEKLNKNSILICHDRFSAELILALFDQCPNVIFDVVELIEHRTHKNLESTSTLQAREIRSAYDLMQKATLITVSPNIAAEINKPMQVVYNGRKSTCWVIKTPSENPKYIAFSGAFFLGCGLDALLEIIKVMPSEYKLLLIGKFTSHAYRIKISNIIQKYDLSARVEIFENCDVTQVPDKLALASAYILPFSENNPNLRVSMPNRLFDALSANLPIFSQQGLGLTDWVLSNNIGTSIDVMQPNVTAGEICMHLNASDNYIQWKANIKTVFASTCYETQMIDLNEYLAKQGILP